MTIQAKRGFAGQLLSRGENAKLRICTLKIYVQFKNRIIILNFDVYFVNFDQHLPRNDKQV